MSVHNGAGYDCHDVVLVNSVWMLASIIHFYQEMGKCGRMAQGEHFIKNGFHLILNLKVFECLNDQFFYEEKINNSEELESTEKNCIIMSKEDEWSIMQQKLLKCAIIDFTDSMLVYTFEK